MTPNQPYMLRAFFDWIVDNDLTPHLVVDATQPYVQVPQQYVQEGQIVLNVSPSACVNFHLSIEGVSFQARFGGQPQQISFPCGAVLAIYARENGAGTVFTPPEPMDSNIQADRPEYAMDDNESDAPPKPEKPARGKPNLSIVK